MRRFATFCAFLVCALVCTFASARPARAQNADLDVLLREYLTAREQMTKPDARVALEGEDEECVPPLARSANRQGKVVQLSPRDVRR